MNLPAFIESLRSDPNARSWLGDHPGDDVWDVTDRPVGRKDVSLYNVTLIPSVLAVPVRGGDPIHVEASRLTVTFTPWGSVEAVMLDPVQGRDTLRSVREWVDGVLDAMEEGVRPRGRSQRFIRALAQSFPCLQDVDPLGSSGDFDPDALVARFRPGSTGEKLVVAFLVNVWNQAHAKKKRYRFDALDFLSDADGANRAAFLAWAARPTWP